MVYVLSYVYFLAAILCFVVPVPVSSAPLPNISRIDTSSAEYSAPGPRRSAESTTIKFQQNLKLLFKHYGVNHARYGVNMITNKQSELTEHIDVQQFDRYRSTSSNSPSINNTPNNNTNLDYSVVDVGDNLSKDITFFTENTTSILSTIQRRKREVNQNKRTDLKTRNSKSGQYHHPRRRHRHHFHHHRDKSVTTNSPQVVIQETPSVSLNTIANEETVKFNTSNNKRLQIESSYERDGVVGGRNPKDNHLQTNLTVYETYQNHTDINTKDGALSEQRGSDRNNGSRASNTDFRKEVNVDVDNELVVKHTTSNSNRKDIEQVSHNRTADVIHTHTANTGIEDDNVVGVNQTRIRASRETSSGNGAGPNEHEIDENAGRNERSTSLITGTERKIHMYIMNSHLQILPDGTVNGAETDDSDFTIFQRISVRSGQVKIYGVKTCQFVCMDECGLLYGSREFDENCVFNETYKINNLNTYISARYSNKNRVMYLALDKHGESRKVQVKSIHTPLGKMSLYAGVLPKPVAAKRVEKLDSELLCTLRDNQTATTSKPMQSTQHPVRHQHGLQVDHASSNADGSSDVKKFRCRKRRKRKNNRKKSKNDKSDKNRHEKSVDGNSEPQHRKHLQTSSNSTGNNGKKKKKQLQTSCTLVSSDSEKCISVDRSRNINKQFIFNGVPHRDCDEYKNVNKKKKCELAQRRQKTKNADASNSKTSAKMNFQSGEVDATKVETGVKRTEELSINRPALKTLNQNAAGSELEQRTVNEMVNQDGDNARGWSLSNSNAQNTPSQVFGDGSSSPSWGIDGGTVDDDVHFAADNVDQFLEEEYDWLPMDDFGRDDFVERSDTTTFASTLAESNFSVSPPPDNLNDDYDSSMLDDV